MKTSFHAHRGFRFYRWFVPHHLLWVHHRAGSITEYLESFKLRLGNYSHEVKVPFIRANRTSVRSFPFWWCERESNHVARRVSTYCSTCWATTPNVRLRTSVLLGKTQLVIISDGLSIILLMVNSFLKGTTRCCDWRTRTFSGGRPNSVHETDATPASQ